MSLPSVNVPPPFAPSLRSAGMSHAPLYSGNSTSSMTARPMTPRPQTLADAGTNQYVRNVLRSRPTEVSACHAKIWI